MSLLKRKLFSSFIVFPFISFLLIGCDRKLITTNEAKKDETGHYQASLDETQKLKNENRHPIIEVWKEVDGSVPIRGNSLYFRMSGNRLIECDYELRKKNEGAKPPYTFFIERNSLIISDKEFERFEFLIDDIKKNENIKREYKPIGLTLDVITKLTILLNDNGNTVRKIEINDTDYDIVSSKYEKNFPNSIVSLIKEIQLIRSRLQEDTRFDSSERQ